MIGRLRRRSQAEDTGNLTLAAPSPPAHACITDRKLSWSEVSGEFGRTVTPARAGPGRNRYSDVLALADTREPCCIIEPGGERKGPTGYRLDVEGVSCSSFMPAGWAGRHHAWEGAASGVKTHPHQRRRHAGRVVRRASNSIRTPPHMQNSQRYCLPSRGRQRWRLPPSTFRPAVADQSPRPSWSGTRSESVV